MGLFRVRSGSPFVEIQVCSTVGMLMYDNNYLYYCIDMDYLIYDRFLNIFPLSGTVYKTYHFFIFDRIFL